MDGEFFLLSINEYNEPGKLRGPASWSDCIEKLTSLLRADKIEITPEIKSAIDMDGFYNFDNGSGLYIIMSESMES